MRARRRAACRSRRGRSSPTTACSRSSARAAWGWSGRRSTRASTARSRSSCSPTNWPRDRERLQRLRARGQGGRRAQPPQHRHHLLGRGGRRRRTSSPWSSRRAARSPSSSRPAACRCRAFLDIAVPLADALAAAHARRHRPPRHQAGQHHGRRRRARQGPRLRARQDAAASAGEPAGSTAPRRTSESTSLLRGTLPTCRPSSIRGAAVDHRSDIFSLGVVLYEMATGRRPFDGRHGADDHRRHPAATPPPLATALRRDCPRRLEPARRASASRRTRRAAAAIRRRAARRARRSCAASRRRPAARPAPSIAVLPFVDMSLEQGPGLLLRGHRRGDHHRRWPGSATCASPRAPRRFQLPRRALDSRDIGRELGVDALLEGSVRKAGDRLRITRRADRRRATATASGRSSTTAR